MNQNPVTGFPENPDKKSREEQVKILIERHNFLVDQIAILEDSFFEKEKYLDELRRSILDDLSSHKELLAQNQELLRVVKKLKKDASADFKQIVKRPVFNKLEKRINDLNYEDYVFREELMRRL